MSAKQPFDGHLPLSEDKHEDQPNRVVAEVTGFQPQRSATVVYAHLKPGARLSSNTQVRFGDATGLEQPSVIITGVQASGQAGSSVIGPAIVTFFIDRDQPYPSTQTMIFADQ